MANKAYLEPTLFRSATLRGFDQAPEISRTGGEFNAGYIKNFAVITAGEALGHGAWVDHEFVSQLAAELSSAKKGIKSRYTHPNQCGDSLSKGLGRVFYRADGDGKVRGDLHFWKAAHKTPDGDLAGFLLDLATDDPEAFGASISFMRDAESEEMFAAANPTSPDPANVNNYPHVRLGQLRFVDIVDEPAANPDGLFHRDDTAAQAAELLEYGLGLSDVKPTTQMFGVDADRLLGFVSNFLSLKGLQIVELNKDEQISEEVNETPIVEELQAEEVVVEEVVAEEAPCCEAEECECDAPEVEVVEEVVAEEAPEAPEVDEVEEIVDGGTEPAESPVEKGHFSKEELGLYIENFGKNEGLEFFMNGLDFQAAQAEYIKSQKEQIESLNAQIELSEQTENQPLSGNNGEAVETKGNGFKVTIK